MVFAVYVVENSSQYFTVSAYIDERLRMMLALHWLIVGVPEVFVATVAVVLYV